MAERPRRATARYTTGNFTAAATRAAEAGNNSGILGNIPAQAIYDPDVAAGSRGTATHVASRDQR